MTDLRKVQKSASDRLSSSSPDETYIRAVCCKTMRLWYNGLALSYVKQISALETYSMYEFEQI